MKKYFLILVLPFLFFGCTPIAIKQEFPKPFQDMLIPCPELTTLQDTIRLSVVLDNVSANYAQYHICRARVDSWIKWYNEQKKISDEAMND